MRSIPAPPEATPIARAEWLWLVAAIVLGAAIRLGLPGRMAVEHFDEGVYASNFWFGAEDGYQYPARQLYAPPLLPLAIEITMIAASICGVTPIGIVPMFPGLVAGLATIPSLWWVGRRWFGPVAGLVAAWLAAASDFHATYSRTALTDVPVGLFLLWGTYFVRQGLTSGHARDLVLASLFTGLSWWTKYTGWLPLAIGLAGSAGWQMSLPRAEREIARVARRWGLIVAGAFVVWLPVLVGLQPVGGYASVSANHRQYVIGLTGWLPDAIRQLGHAGLYDGWLGSWAPLPTVPLLMLATSLVAASAWIIRNRSSRTANAGWFLAAWIVGLSVAIPCYQPYPRLIMPWLIANWLGVGLAVNWGAAWMRDRSPNRANAVRPRWLAIAVASGLIVTMGVRLQTGAAQAWRDRTGLARAAETLAPLIRREVQAAGFPGDQAIVYVFGEPALVFAWKAGGLVVGPIQNLEFASQPTQFPTFLAWSDHAQRTPEFVRSWQADQAKFDLVTSQTVTESPLVGLDHPDGLPTLEANSGGVTLHLYRVR